MITFLITLAVVWIALKVITLLVEIPFKLIKLVFSLAGSAIFWVLLIIAFIVIL